MKNHWFKVRIKMKLINSMRESIFEGLKNDRTKLFYAKQRLNKLEQDFFSFNAEFKKFINEYSEFLPDLKTTEQVCDNCQSNQVVRYEDVLVCQECGAVHSFVGEDVCEARQKQTTYNNVRQPVNNFKERILSLNFFSEELVRDYKSLVLKIRENPSDRITNKDFCVLCLALKNEQKPPEGLSIPSGEAALVTVTTKVRNLFEKLGWTFPLSRVKEYILAEKTRRARSSLDVL